jgi:hypothetical protein
VRQAKRLPRPHMLLCIEDGISKNKWVEEIDPEYSHLFPNIPPEGSIGSWYIGASGTYTGEFRPNPDYKGPIET